MERRGLLKAAVAALAAPFVRANEIAEGVQHNARIEAGSGRTEDNRPTLRLDIPIGEPGEEIETQIDWLQLVQVKGSAFAVLQVRLRTRPVVEGEEPEDWDAQPVRHIDVLGRAVRNTGGRVVQDSTTYPQAEQFGPVWVGRT